MLHTLDQHDLDKHFTEECPKTRRFVDNAGGPVCVKDEFVTYDLDNLQHEFVEGDLLDDPEEYASIYYYDKEEWSDEEELMDFVTRKYAPSTLPYPLLFGGGSSDEGKLMFLLPLMLGRKTLSI